MSTYKGIKGESIVGVASNFTSPSTEGQVFYNTTDNVFKSLVATKAWHSGANLGSSRYGLAACGIQTAQVVAGGSDLPFGTLTDAEEYNGTGWSTISSIGTARYGLAGCGTSTASLIFGGNYPGRKNETEEWNGTSWSEQNNLNTARRLPGGSGSQTDGLAVAGDQGPSVTVTADVEEYNGTSWSEQNNIPTAVRGGSSAGTTSANSMFFGGYTGTERVTNSFEYDGTNWTTTASLNTARNELNSSGDKTGALAFGGTSTTATATNITEEYDGTSWTTSPATMGTVSHHSAKGTNGSNTAAIRTGGRISPTGVPGMTEEYNVSINTITAAAWASGGNMNSSLRDRGGAGTQTAALAAGGENPRTDNSEEYDGTSWSEGNNLVSTDRNQLCGAGSQTAALMFGGEDSTTTNVSQTEEYDGTSYTESNDMSNGRRDFQGFGTQTAAVAASGWTPPGVSTYNTAVEHYDGTSWSSGTAVPAARAQGAGYGTQTAGLIVGGTQPGSPVISSSVEYDGSSWTAGGSMNKARNIIAQGNGSQTSALAASGGPGNMTNCEIYNGTSWVTTASVSTGRGQANGLMSSAGATAGLIAGGYDTANRNATEEFTGETSALGFSTITTS